MSRVLAVANQKGGVGKTTTAINLGAALAALENQVLLVDCDPQGNASRGLALDLRPPHLYHVLTGEATMAEAIQETGMPFMNAVAAGRDLVGVEVEFVDIPDWQNVLRNRLEPVRGGYHTVLIDCPPSLGHLTVSALSAADGVIIPLQCEYFALEGVSEVLGTVRRIQATVNPRLMIAGILLTMYDERTNLAKQVAQEIRDHFDDQVYRTVVPRNVRLAEAPSYGLPIVQYDIGSRGAEAYLSLAREYLGRAA